MKALIKISMCALCAALFVACAAPCSSKDSMLADPYVGSETSPYRSIPAVVYCDDCRYRPAR